MALGNLLPTGSLNGKIIERKNGGFSSHELIETTPNDGKWKTENHRKMLLYWDLYIYIYHLVGGDWNMTGLFVHIFGMSSFQLTNSYIFQRGWVGQQPDDWDVLGPLVVLILMMIFHISHLWDNSPTWLWVSQSLDTWKPRSRHGPQEKPRWISMFVGCQLFHIWLVVWNIVYFFENVVNNHPD